MARTPVGTKPKKKPPVAKRRRFDDPDVLMALDLYVGALLSSEDKRIAGNGRAVAREMGVVHRTVQFWLRDAWWNVLGCEPTASNETANAVYWKKVKDEGHSAVLDNAYSQFQAQRGVNMNPQPED